MAIIQESYDFPSCHTFYNIQPKTTLFWGLSFVKARMISTLWWASILKWESANGRNVFPIILEPVMSHLLHYISRLLIDQPPSVTRCQKYKTFKDSNFISWLIITVALLSAFLYPRVILVRSKKLKLSWEHSYQCKMSQKSFRVAAEGYNRKHRRDKKSFHVAAERVQ